MCVVWLRCILLLNQRFASCLVIVMREKGSVQGSMERRVQRSVRRGVNSGGSEERGMVSNGGLVMSGTVSQEGSVVSCQVVSCQVVGRSVDQGSRRVDWGVQRGCSHDGCHDACQVVSVSASFEAQFTCSSRTWFVNEGGGRVFGLNSGLVRLDVGSESECVSDVVHDSQASVSVSQTVRAHLTTMSITCIQITSCENNSIPETSSHQSLVGKIHQLRGPRCIRKRSFRCSMRE